MAARADQSEIWWVFLLEGIAALIFGALLLTNPAATLVALAIFLGFYLLFIGVLELVRMFVDRGQPWIWSLLLGILGIAAGIIGAFSGGGVGSFLLGLISLLIGALLLGAPLVTALAVPFVFGILLLIQGVAQIVYAFRVKG
jgi:uncharacterized membrane protein HdeD (DUF308 family)